MKLRNIVFTFKKLIYKCPAQSYVSTFPPKHWSKKVNNEKKQLGLDYEHIIRDLILSIRNQACKCVWKEILLGPAAGVWGLLNSVWRLLWSHRVDIMSKAHPSRVEEIYGQEVIIEIKWWQTCSRNIVGIWLYESCDRWMCGDGN